MGSGRHRVFPWVGHRELVLPPAPCSNPRYLPFRQILLAPSGNFTCNSLTAYLGYRAAAKPNQMARNRSA
jgi:hypothetical protein